MERVSQMTKEWPKPKSSGAAKRSSVLGASLVILTLALSFQEWRQDTPRLHPAAPEPQWPR